MREKAGQILLHYRRHAERIVLVEEDRLAVLPQRLVNMCRGPDLVVMPFRQERHRVALLPADLLGGMFGDAAMVGCQHCLGIFDVKLFLSRLGLALEFSTGTPAARR